MRTILGLHYGNPQPRERSIITEIDLFLFCLNEADISYRQRVVCSLH